eukprot:TRINITY_DN9474_c0_g1_i9.p1 TRINITY_DN9474_c0_g1~~TRINITY_DN9474_c0_g1_i9.p1  ORF type:complete len:487 (+),score=96.39 TRINITY_DN9474_c0_g1_i9:229-1689(+)
MSLRKCLICFEHCDHLLQLDCACQLCQSCFFSWTQSFCKESVFTDHILLPCPFEGCGNFMESSQFLLLLTPQQRETISEYLLRHYLTHESDIQSCPNSHCNFSGISGHLPPACSNYVCSKCGSTWSKTTGKETQVKSWTSFFTEKKNEFLSNVVKRFTGNFCPNCSIHIAKLAGCSHLVCRKCKYEFCWRCLGPYYEYTHLGIQPCGLRNFYRMFFGVLFIVLGFIKVSVHFPVLGQILSALLWFIKLIVLGVVNILIIVALIALLMYDVYKFSKTYRKSKQRVSKFVLRLLLYTVLIGITVVYNYFLYKYSVFVNMWAVLLFVAFILLFLFLGSVAIMKGFEAIDAHHKLVSWEYFNLGICVFCFVLTYFEYYAKLIFLLLLGMSLILHAYRLAEYISTNRMKGRICWAIARVLLVLVATSIYISILSLCGYRVICRLLVEFGVVLATVYVCMRTKHLRIILIPGIVAAEILVYHLFDEPVSRCD